MSFKTKIFKVRSFFYDRLLPAAFLWLIVFSSYKIVSVLAPNFLSAKLVAENVLPTADAFTDVLMLRLTAVAVVAIIVFLLVSRLIFNLNQMAKDNQRQYTARMMDDFSSALTHLGCAMLMSIYLTAGYTAAMGKLVAYSMGNILIAFLVSWIQKCFWPMNGGGN